MSVYVIPPWETPNEYTLAIWWKDLTPAAQERVLQFYNTDSPPDSWLESVDPVACVLNFRRRFLTMEMSKEARKALLAIIAKFENFIKNGVLDENWELCDLYLENNCKSCPINIAVGGERCQNAPYGELEAHYWTTHSPKKQMVCSECEELAQKELAFLKSLL